MHVDLNAEFLHHSSGNGPDMAGVVSGCGLCMGASGTVVVHAGPCRGVDSVHISCGEDQGAPVP